MQYEFVLTGATPLLMHADDIEAADELERWRKDPKNKAHSKSGDDRSPPWTWIANLHTDGEVVAIPAGEMLMKCLSLAGAELIMKKQKTFKAAANSFLRIVEDYLPVLVNGKTIPVAPIEALRGKPFADHHDVVKGLGFRLFTKRAKIGNNKHVRVRPRFDQWELRGTVDADDEVSGEVLGRMFDIAGRLKGLGDWRPSSPKSPGPFGMFTAVVKAKK